MLFTESTVQSFVPFVCTYILSNYSVFKCNYFLSFCPHYAFKKKINNCPNRPWLCPFLCSLTPVLTFRINPKPSLGASVTVKFTDCPVLSHI